MVRLPLALLMGLALIGAAPAASDVVPCFHVVGAADTLFELGRRLNLTQQQIVAVNPQLKDPNLLQLGSVIALPCNESAPATSGASVLDLLAGRPDMGTLVRAVAAAGLADELADPSFVGTVFAPNDTAFEALLERVLVNETVEELLADKPRLADLLGYHVVPGEALAAAALVDGLNLTTAEGELLQVYKPANVTRLATSEGQKVRVVVTDLEAGKAVVHTTKGVLLPLAFGASLPSLDGECVHTVEEGDTLYALADKYGTSVASLIDWNPDLEKNPGLLNLGYQLVVQPDCTV